MDGGAEADDDASGVSPGGGGGVGARVGAAVPGSKDTDRDELDPAVLGRLADWGRGVVGREVAPTEERGPSRLCDDLEARDPTDERDRLKRRLDAAWAPPPATGDSSSHGAHVSMLRSAAVPVGRTRASRPR